MSTVSLPVAVTLGGAYDRRSFFSMSTGLPDLSQSEVFLRWWHRLSVKSRMCPLASAMFVSKL